MRFCPQCDSLMNKTTTPAGTIIFHCKCQYTIAGTDADTLMSEILFSVVEEKHSILRKQSPHDPAANIVYKDCPQCGLNFLTLIRIGINETTMYTCTCGFSATHTDYIKLLPVKN